MARLRRFGISIEEDLLRRFDRLVLRRGFPNRSRAIRDLVRSALVDEEWQRGRQVVGALTIVYDHSAGGLNGRLTAIQHDFHDVVVSTLHVHLDHDHCLEVLALRGEPKRIALLRDRLRAQKGVEQCRLAITAGS